MIDARKAFDSQMNNSALDKMDLGSMIYPLWINRKFILTLVIMFAILGWAYSYFKIPLYAGSVLLQVESKNNNFLSGKDFLGSSFLPNQAPSVLDVQTALIKSNYILVPVIQHLKLDVKVQPAYFPIIGGWYSRNYPNLDQPWWSIISGYAWGDERIDLAKFEVPDSERNKRYSLVVKNETLYDIYDDNKQYIGTGEVGKEKTIYHEDKGKYVILVNQLIANVNTHFYIYKYSNQKLVGQLSKQIQIADLGRDMNLQNPTGILKLTLTGYNPQKDIQILNEISKVSVERNANSKLEETSKKIDFINAQLPKIRESLNQAETNLAQYLSKHGLMDVSMASKLLMSEITNVQKNLSMVRINKAVALKNYTVEHPIIIGLVEKEKIYRHELENVEARIKKLPARDQKIINLVREVRVRNQLYLALLRQLQGLEVTKGSTISDVTIIDSAQLPDNSLPKGTFSFVLLLSMLGAILGSSIVLAQEFWDRKVTDPSILETEFNLTTMAIIPYSKKQTDVTKTKHTQTPFILAQSDPKDITIEALRSFRTSLQFVLMNSKNNIITITGIAPNVGKSFISINFAYLLADVGKKILLIDGDIRRGQLQKHFGMNKVKGLTELICKTVSTDQVVIKQIAANLDFLPCGLYPPNPSELLMNEELERIMKRFSSTYDLVVIDTAPILAVTDPAVLAVHAGANFLVIGSSMHDRKEIQLALKRFNTNGVTINGVVFNFAKQQKGLNRSSINYNYQYSYN